MNRSSDCTVHVTAYPYKGTEGEFFSAEKLNSGVLTLDDVKRDVALWFLDELFPITVTQLEAGAALEPEAGALPINSGGWSVSSTNPEQLIPWGWGFVSDTDTRAFHELDLRRPPPGFSVRLTPPGSGELERVGDEFIQRASGDETQDARVCLGDSGGPLLRSSNGTDTVAAVLSIVQAAKCPSPFGRKYWSRVDTNPKRQWIEDTIRLWEGDAFGCRPSPGPPEYVECWPNRCDSNTECNSDEVCAPNGLISLAGKRAGIKRPKRCQTKIK
ncbi:MAG TPA: hypothetical protein VEX18_07600 [Polyangiaceae bacterium]|nr:hypothetical protein [Polyangiaceae bacterium]